MAEQTQERLAQIQFSVLKVLQTSADGMQVNNVLAAMDKLVPPTDFELGVYASGGIRRPKIIKFATIGLVKAGWITKEHGIWKITPEGSRALVDFPQPLALRAENHRLYHIWKSSQSEDIVEESNLENEATVELAVSIEDAETNAFELVSSYLGSMNPYVFQDLIKALLEGMGYHVAWVAPPGKDGGVDLVAFQDHFGAQGPRIKVQVKRQVAAAGVESIRSFLGVLSDRDDIGLYICLGGFSSDAEKEARTHASKRLTLIDAKKLYVLWIEHYEKLSESQRSLLPLKAVYYLDLD